MVTPGSFADPATCWTVSTLFDFGCQPMDYMSPWGDGSRRYWWAVYDAFGWFDLDDMGAGLHQFAVPWPQAILGLGNNSVLMGSYTSGGFEDVSAGSWLGALNLDGTITHIANLPAFYFGAHIVTLFGEGTFVRYVLGREIVEEATSLWFQAPWLLDRIWLDPTNSAGENLAYDQRHGWIIANISADIFAEEDDTGSLFVFELDGVGWTGRIAQIDRPRMPGIFRQPPWFSMAVDDGAVMLGTGFYGS